MERDPSLRFSISCTTRPRRPNEEEGRDYYFVDRDEFQRRVNAGRPKAPQAAPSSGAPDVNAPEASFAPLQPPQIEAAPKPDRFFQKRPGLYQPVLRANPPGWNPKRS